MKQKNSLIRLIALVVFGFFIGCAFLEVGLRVMLGNRVDFQYYNVYDPLVGYKHRSNFHLRIPFPEHPSGYFDLVTESNGLREDQDVPVLKPANSIRILVLGDSQTDGTVFNHESYPNLLEENLKHEGFEVDVLNAGVTTYDPFKELLWFHYYGRLYAPDIVILSIYLGNDLVEIEKHNEISFIDKKLYIDGVEQLPPETDYKKKVVDLLRRSYLIATIQSIYMPNAITDGSLRANSEAIKICKGCFWQSLNQLSKIKSGQTRYDESLLSVQETITALDKTVKEEYAQLVILLIPTKRQVEGEESIGQVFFDTAGHLGLAPGDLIYVDMFRNDLVDFAVNESITLLDPTEELIAVHHAAKKYLFYNTDWHLNPFGHESLADYLSDIIINEEEIYLFNSLED